MAESQGETLNVTIEREIPFRRRRSGGRSRSRTCWKSG